MAKRVTKIHINFNDGEPVGKYQIYPSEDLSKQVEKYRKSHPSRMSTSAAICILLSERLAQIEAAAILAKKL